MESTSGGKYKYVEWPFVLVLLLKHLLFKGESIDKASSFRKASSLGFRETLSFCFSSLKFISVWLTFSQ